MDSLKEGESSLRGGQLKGGRMVVTEVASLIGEWSCYRGGHFNGEKMITLQRWSVYWKENGHVTEVVTLIKGEWPCYTWSL